MKKLVLVTFLLLLVPSLTAATDFLPTKLQLTAPEAVQYDFDGSNLEIPVTVTGTTARVFFFVFTKDKGDEIGEVQNGYLGWHYVNHIDTCVFMSDPFDFQAGSNAVTWNGLDSDGGAVPADEYTYYMWAYDYENPPESNKAAHAEVSFKGKESSVNLIEKEEDGTPKAQPWFIDYDTVGVARKWIIGSDPENDLLLETTDLQIPEEWRYQNPPPVSPNHADYTMWYFCEANKEALVLTLRRATWVPNDLAERDPEWGLESAECFRKVRGPLDDGNYIYFGKNDTQNPEVCSNFYIMDYEGDYVASIQNNWWIKPDQYALGAKCLQGGPRWHSLRGSYIMQGTYHTLHSTADPLRYLESMEYDDFERWINQNGDYVLDRCSEPDCPTPWLNFCESAPYPRSIYADANFFCVAPCRGIGAVSIACLAPDGTGIGYLAFAGESGDTSRDTIIIDNGSAYDGMYVDGFIDGDGLGFLGHDSLKGMISQKVSVADEAPSAFAVEQNSPNPANPSTTISFILPEAGTVTVDIFNVAGQKMDTLINDFMDSGRHSVVWDGSNFSTGVYFYTVTSGEFSKTMKMTLLK